MGGSSNDTPPTQTTQYVASPQEQELMALGLPGVRAFASQGVPQQYPGSTVVPFNQAQQAGQWGALEAIPRQEQLAAQGALATNRALGFNPESGREAAASAVARPLYQNLAETVFPGIRSEAGGAGQYGGSRQGIAEGIATGRTAQAAGDAIAKMQPELYQADLKAQMQALGLLPSTTQAQLSPAVTAAGVGDVQAQKEQEYLQEAINKFYYPQYASLAQSQDILSLLGALPRTGQNVATGSIAPNKGPGVGQALAGAASGATIGGAVGGPLGAGVGAAGGAVLPFLFA